MSSDLAERILRGDRGAVARLIRLIDDRAGCGLEALRAVYPASAGARIVGVTGAPGSGKSTLVDRLVEVARGRGERVGVVAVDPSSPFTGGAVLGDRIRMQRHSGDDGVFIRSFATRGRLGGISASTRDALAVLAAAGFRTLFVETVGVGQDEVEVARVADTVALVVAPGSGDSVQALKAGVMEIADVFVVNKMDRDGAHETAREIESTLALGRTAAPPDAWVPPVTLACASDGRGIDGVAAALDRHAEHLRGTGLDAARRRNRARLALLDLLRSLLDSELDSNRPGRIDEGVERIASGASDPHTEAAAIFAELTSSGRG